MRASRSLQGDIVRYANALHRQGWVANHDGNITARLAKDRFLATPTATSKEDVTQKNLLEVDDKGARVAGTSRRFSEVNLHLAVYTTRNDVNAVIHAHPPNATAIACSGNNLIERPFIAEAVVSIGPRIPLVPFAAPGPKAADALRPFLTQVDAVLLANHGVLAWGQTLEQAYLRLELVEHLAKIAIIAQPLGGTKELPSDALKPLLEARATAGLGAAADRAVSVAGAQPVIACAPAPHSATPTRGLGSADRGEIAAIIREEIVRSLAPSK